MEDSLPLSPPGFVGRERELAVVQGRLEAACRGQGGVVLVAGEPGIGKTRLLTELAERARRQGWRVLCGRAYELEGSPPYLPIAEALREYLRACPPEQFAAQLGEGAADVATVLPELPRRLAQRRSGPPAGLEAAAAQDRYRIFEAVCDFLVAIAGGGRQPNPPAPFPADPSSPALLPRGEKGVDRLLSPLEGERPEARGDTPTPLLLILDDLHWADTPSLLLLQHLGRRLAGLPLLVAGAYRSGEVDRAHPLTNLLAALRREGMLELLSLMALSAEECSALIATASGQAPAPAVAEALYRATEGSPLFLGEMVRHLQAEGRDLSDPAAAVDDWRVPHALRALIGARLGRLSESAVRLLQAAAVLGDGVRFDVLSDASGIEPQVLLDALDEVLTAGLLREEGDRYGFSHALIRQALHDELSLPRRQRLHRLAAQAIETLYAADLTPHLGALALHYRLAGPGSTAPALAYARRAGEAALAVYAWEEAARHWRAALDLLDPAEARERFELLLELGSAQVQAGQQEALNQTVEAAVGLARQRGDARWLARAVLSYPTTDSGIGSFSADPVRLQLLEEAAAALGGDEPTLRARVLARLPTALRWSGDLARGEAASAEALALARRTGDTTGLIEALLARHHTIAGPEHVAERRALSAEFMRLAEAAGRPDLLSIGRCRYVRDVAESSDIAALDAQLALLARQAADLRLPALLWRSGLCSAARALLAGSFTDAQCLIQQAFSVGSRYPTWGADGYYLCQVMALRAECGGLEQTLPAMQELAERYPAVLSARCGVALALAACGRLPEVRQAWEQLAAGDFADLRRDPLNFPYDLCSLVELCALLGDQDRAQVLYAQLLPHAGLTICIGGLVAIRGSAARYLGILATVLRRWDAAERHFEEALAANERLGAWPALAHTQHELAAMLLTRGWPGDAARAQALLATALEAARRMGMTPLVDQIERRAGGRTAARPTGAAAVGRPAAPAAPDASVPAPLPDRLTPREAEVLRLLAGGLTSKQIAAELVVAVHTVHRHIANLYGKIGARGRADATAYALRQGLIPKGST